MNSAADEASDHNTKIIKKFRANQGRVGGMWKGTALILIRQIGPELAERGERDRGRAVSAFEDRSPLPPLHVFAGTRDRSNRPLNFKGAQRHD